MEFSQLQYFMTVANCGKVTEAAEILHVSQSAISMAISRLENELEVKLFEKHGRLISPTPSGYKLLEMVTGPLAELDHAKNIMLAENQKEPDIISLSIEMPDVASHLEELFGKCNPDARFHQSMDTINTVRQKMVTAKMDFCLSFEPFNSADIVSVLLFTEKVNLQIRKERALVGKESILLEEAAEIPFVSFCPDYGYRKWMDEMCFFAGFRPNICFEVSDTSSLAYFVGKKNAATFIGQSTVEMAINKMIMNEEIAIIPLANSFCQRKVYLSYNKSRHLSPAAEEFLEFAMEFKDYYEKYNSFIAVEQCFE